MLILSDPVLSSHCYQHWPRVTHIRELKNVTCTADIVSFEMPSWCIGFNQHGADAAVMLRTPGVDVIDHRDGMVCLPRNEGDIELFHNRMVDSSKLIGLRCGCRPRKPEPEIRDWFLDPRSLQRNYDQPVHDTVIFAAAPDSRSFQHFIDGVLPKLALTLSLFPTAKIFVLEMPAPQSTAMQILLRLVDGVSERIVKDRQFFCRTLILSCHTPCLHRMPFVLSRKLLRFDVSHGAQRNLVLFFDRPPGVALNGGRRLNNPQRLIDTLRRACAHCRVETFDHRRHTSLDNLQAYLADAIFVVGVHGGAFYNTLILPHNTTVVEIFPTVLYRSNLAKHITWLLSSIYGHTYYRLHTDGHSDDIVFDEARVATILKATVK